jgi:hypothetical protein
LDELIGKPFIGLDSEWRPQMTKFESLRPSILQISNESKVFIIDLIALSSSISLDQTLTKIVTNH